jgi:nicotinate-nucleotide pyrophosphorylase (carboxylating)
VEGNADPAVPSMPAGVRRFIAAAIEEDVGNGDVTTSLLVPREQESTAVLIAKESFVIAGLPFAAEVLRAVDDSAVLEPLVEEGAWVRKSTTLAKVTGKTRSLLAAERVMLNILQRLSGIATLTNKYVRKVQGLETRIVDTRKTTPGMRYMEKYAVRTGGGRNHRFGLYDGILIKDNHIAAVGGVRRAVELARAGGGHLSKIEIEAETLKEFKEALKAGADVVMLDNMPVKDITEAVRQAKKKVTIEVSGNVSLEQVRQIAEAGVDLISIGAITHSAPAMDISMKILK